MIKQTLINLRRGKLVQFVLYVLFRLASILPMKKRTVIFESFLGKQYSDNPKAIYLYLTEHYPQYDCYWSMDRRVIHEFKDENIVTLKRFTLKWIFTLARAKYWVSNSRLPVWIPKRKGTIYLQTWHGTPLKKLAMDMDNVHMPGTETATYKRNFLNETAKWDYLVSPNAYSTKIFKRAFQFDKRMIESGYPRNDVLTKWNNETTIKRLKEEAGLPADKKVLLYAPTWRDNEYHSVGRYKFNLQLDLEQMQAELGGEYILLLRLHYLVAENLQLKGYESFVYNMSDYRDINELYLMADLLITDYSSVFFDYAIRQQPILFFTYDLASYRDELRGFYFDLEKAAPGPLVTTTTDLIKEIKVAAAGDFTVTEKHAQFYQTYCYLEDGQASKRVVETVFDE